MIRISESKSRLILQRRLSTANTATRAVRAIRKCRETNNNTTNKHAAGSRAACRIDSGRFPWHRNNTAPLQQSSADDVVFGRVWRTNQKALHFQAVFLSLDSTRVAKSRF